MRRNETAEATWFYKDSVKDRSTWSQEKIRWESWCWVVPTGVV